MVSMVFMVYYWRQIFSFTLILADKLKKSEGILVEIPS